MSVLCSMSSPAGQTDTILIYPYSAADREHFKRLNVEWITRYFELEDLDNKALENPVGHILKPGGHIVMASCNGEVVGTCALINLGGGEYELAKMAVTESAKGKGIGLMLGEAVIAIAKKEKASKIILLSNRKLLPALNLYRKLGFVEIPLTGTGYKRADIKMEILPG